MTIISISPTGRGDEWRGKAEQKGKKRGPQEARREKKQEEGKREKSIFRHGVQRRGTGEKNGPTLLEFEGKFRVKSGIG